MKVKQLLEGIEVLAANADMEQEISKICYDSRKVKTGDLFVAIKGWETDGHRYIPQAAAQGACAVLCEQELQDAIAYIKVADTRRALAQISANYFGHPAGSMTMIGVTGTNGKTTVTYLIKEILEFQGFKVGLIGTNQNMIAHTVLETERTTPESYELQELFARMKKEGCSHVVMEVSSHSLTLSRVYGINFTVGVFTNLTQDHLDFHGTMEAYRQAKSKLFSQASMGVLNLDDEASSTFLSEHKGCRFLTYAAKSQADVTAENLRLKAQGVTFDCICQGEKREVSLGIPGEFSVYNALAAIGCCASLQVPFERSAQALTYARGVKGRAEVVPTPGAGYTVLIDYAHTPDGVENILKAVRSFAKGRVVALFGCGGDRDRGKRPKMGRIAAGLADWCIVTSDNPRTEQPEAIIEDILAGMRGSKTPYEVIVSRPEAIQFALAHAQKDDVLVFMGKGHETYQEINHQKHHLDEREEVGKFFAQKEANLL